MRVILTNQNAGFSILEVVIALALLTVVLTGALAAQGMSEYWALTSQVAAEAQSIAYENLGRLRQTALVNFHAVSSTESVPLISTTSPFAASCRSGGLCYFTNTEVLDVSPCAKNVTVVTTWRIAQRYPTSTIAFKYDLFSSNELIAQGSDCVIEPLPELWGYVTPQRGAVATSSPTFSTGIDVLGERIYIVASSAPMMRIYEHAADTVVAPRLLDSSSLLGNRLNAIDVIKDTASGRIYAYVVAHTRTNQLLVLDVTDDTIVQIGSYSLVGTDPLGSFPQGWRVKAYGKRLYVLTRETAGAELHIFSIENPTFPIEISSGAVNLARTVNDVVVREQLIGSTTRRYLFFAASAALKELGIYEVTNDIPIERVAIDLPGSENALSLALGGDTLYLGRQQSGSGPELFQYKVSELIGGSAIPNARSEVGADVHTLGLVGSVLLVGTNRTGAEFQTWQASGVTWNDMVPNTARISAVASSRLAPLGIDIGVPFVYTVSQSISVIEQLSIWSN